MLPLLQGNKSTSAKTMQICWAFTRTVSGYGDLLKEEVLINSWDEVVSHETDEY